MTAVTYTEARQNLKALMDETCRDHSPIIITRQTGGHAVMLSYEDYRSIEETAYLLRSPVMAKRLRDSLKSFDKGGGKRRKLIEIK